MSEKNKQEIVTVEDTEVLSGEVDGKYEILLSKPYIFEGEEYKKIDLIGLETLTGKDMIDIDRKLEKTGSFSIIPEMTKEYALLIACKSTGKPIEFFYGMSPKDVIKIKNKVTGFFYSQD